MMGNKKVGLISFSFSSYSCKTNTTAAWFIMSVISEEEITSAEWWLILY